MSDDMKKAGSLKVFFAEVPGSLQGYLNSRELLRVVFLALAAGGGMTTMLASLRDSLNTVLVNPNDVGLVSALIVAAIEIQRRLQHGQELTNASK